MARTGSVVGLSESCRLYRILSCELCNVTVLAMFSPPLKDPAHLQPYEGGERRIRRFRTLAELLFVVKIVRNFDTR